MNHCAFDDSTACDAPGFPYNTYCVSGNRFGLDPLFVDPDAGDFRLQPCSPLIDTGDNAAAAGISEDIGGQPRIQDGTVDMGAYESPAFGLAAEPAVAPACDSMATGAVSIPLAGACQPLTVFWQSGPLTGNSTDSLAAGFYVFTITDAKGRSVAFNAAVPSAVSPTLQADGTPISCFGASDATLSVSPLTGQEPFTYQWEPQVSTDSAAANLGPGPVSVTATDAGGCSAVFSFDIPEPDSLQFSATVQHASTQQSADGSILVNSVSGGTPPYHFLWEPGSSMESMIGNLTPGFYTLRVTDERGCESVRTYEVSFTNRVADAGGSHPELQIFPNPATDAFSLFWNGRQEIPVVIELYDGLGRQVRRTEVPPGGHGPLTVRVPLEGLAPGYHRVLLRDAGGRVLGSGNIVKM